MENVPPGPPLIVINGWTIEQGSENATVTITPPANTTGVIQIEWVSGDQSGMKVSWHLPNGTNGNVNANRPSAPVDVEPGDVVTLTGFYNGNPWGPADSPTQNGTNKAQATFGPEGTRMTISIVVPGVKDPPLN